MLRNGTSSLEDVEGVGKWKLVGYKTLSDLFEKAKICPSRLGAGLQQRGLKTLTLTGNECVMSSGALYAWHEAGLRDHLQKHAATLEEGGWPCDPESFVRKLAVDWAPRYTELYNVIADAFGDGEVRGRTRPLDDSSFPEPGM
jgi:hypothetical protein